MLHGNKYGTDQLSSHPSMALQHASAFSGRLPVGGTPSCRHAALTTSSKLPSKPRFRLSASQISWSGGGSVPALSSAWTTGCAVATSPPYATGAILGPTITGGSGAGA